MTTIITRGNTFTHTTQTGAEGDMTATKEPRFQLADDLAQDLVLLQSINIRDPVKA